MDDSFVVSKLQAFTDLRDDCQTVLSLDFELCVSRLQAVSDLPGALTRFANRHWTTTLYDRCQIRSFDKFHCQKMNITRLLGIKGCHDVRMSQPSGRLHFSLKSFDALRMLDQLRIDQIQSDGPIHQFVFGAKHVTHAAFADLLDDAIAGMVLQFRRQFGRLSRLARLHDDCRCVAGLIFGRCAFYLFVCD